MYIVYMYMSFVYLYIYMQAFGPGASGPQQVCWPPNPHLGVGRASGGLCLLPAMILPARSLRDPTIQEHTLFLKKVEGVLDGFN